MTATLLAGLLAAAALVSGATAASAHAALLETDPEDGARLDAAPSSVRLVFSDPLNPDFVRVRVDGPGGAVSPEPVTKGDTVTVPITDAGPGGYRVLYRVVSKDGHPVSGSATFTVSGTPSASPSTSTPAVPSTAPSTVPGSAPADGTPAAGPTAAQTSDGVPGVLLAVLAAAGLVLLAALAAAGVLFARRRGGAR